ncbi:MAG TPA: ABC transporter substrate-binding protein, partial [Chloroflexota bacterium]
HRLEQQLHSLDPNAFLALPFWTVEYVGAGPFRLDHWESGAYFDVSAFGGHVLGRPQIDRIHVTFIGDANTALANLLSGEVSLVVDDAMTFQQAAVAQQEWESTHAGTILVQPSLWRTIQIQLVPERQGANAHVLSDVRARKALMSTIDKQAINDGVYARQAILADSLIPPTVNYYSEVDAAVVKYPFDPARAAQLMNDVGYTKGTDGLFTSPAQGRLSLELMITQGAQNATVQQILASTWRRAGFDISQAILPQAQAQDPQVRAMFEAMVYTGGNQGEDQLPNFTSSSIPHPENRWNGTNRGSWVNPDFDRLAEAYNTTLDAKERAHQIAQLVQIFSDELPSFSINFDPGTTSFRSNLSGPALSAPGSSTAWNIWQWQVQ